jgi:cell division protein ZipA
MTNWSLILNVFLLIGVVFAILSMLKNKNQEKRRRRMYRVEPAPVELQQDDIIAVRKLNTEDAPQAEQVSKVAPVSEPKETPEPIQAPESKPVSKPVSLMMFLLAKDNRQLGGYLGCCHRCGRI